jgi:Uma2 family endonuclease
VLEWVEGLYEEQVFTGDNLISSTVLGDLELTVDRVLQGR